MVDLKDPLLVLGASTLFTKQQSVQHNNIQTILDASESS